MKLIIHDQTVEHLYESTHTTVMLFTHPFNDGPPRHIHENEDELFIVQSGTFKYYCGDSIIKAVPGDTVLGKKGVRHRFVCTSHEGGSHLIIFSPGGGADYFKETAMILNLSDQGDRKEKFGELGKKYGVKILRG